MATNRSSTNASGGAQQHQHHHFLFNYHDAVLYPSDLEILDSPTAWLNDAVIHFQLTRLQHRRHDGAGNEKMTPDCSDDDEDTMENLFLDPSVISFVIHQLIRKDYNDYKEYHNELTSLNASWKLPRVSSLPPSMMSFNYFCEKSKSDIVVTRRRLFIPICDQFGSSRVEFAEPGGGRHWSLLLWEVIARYYPKGNHVQFISSFSHFDSSSGYNAHAATKVAEKLGVDVLQCWGTDDDDDNFHVWMEGDPYFVNVVECSQVPQQNNGYDCGVFALGFAEAISSASTQQLYPDGKIDRATKKEDYEAIVRAHFEENGGPNAYAVMLRRQIGNDIRMLASSS